MSLKDDILSKYKSFTPDVQRKISIGLIIFALMGSSVVWSYMNREDTPDPATLQPKVEKKDVTDSLDADLFEKTELMESRKKAAALEDTVASLVKKQTEMEQQMSAPPGQPPVPTGLTALEKAAGVGQGSMPPTKVPLPPVPKPGQPQVPPPPPSADPYANGGPGMQAAPIVPPKPNYQRLDKIKSESNKNIDEKAEAAKAAEEAKKKEQMITLPSGSFMKTRLLSGLDAPISGSGGKANPVPVLLRIQNLAQLPSSVRRDLRGCFALADGYGDLATERVDLRIKNISCLDKHDRALIDQPLQGYLVDTDGKIGLRGKVVWRGGAVVANSALAGFIAGIGSGIKSSTSSTSLTAIGTSTVGSTSPKDILLAGAGEGMSNAADDLSKFLLELGKQQMPVVEVGATKEATMVILNKTELKIVPLEKD